MWSCYGISFTLGHFVSVGINVFCWRSFLDYFTFYTGLSWLDLNMFATCGFVLLACTFKSTPRRYCILSDCNGTSCWWLAIRNRRKEGKVQWAFRSLNRKSTWETLAVYILMKSLNFTRPYLLTNFFQFAPGLRLKNPQWIPQMIHWRSVYHAPVLNSGKHFSR